MPDFKVIVFDVEHGFCAFIKSPTGRTMFIDCGKATKFSPIHYVINNELSDCIDEGNYYFTKFILTHPHGDHIEDVDTLIDHPPRLMFRQNSYDWGKVKKSNSDAGAENVETYDKWQKTYNQPGSKIDWGLSIYHADYLTPSQAESIDKSKMVNNSSIPVIIIYQGTKYTEKFLFAGDLEEKGWLELLKRQSFKDAIKGTDFFITSHHGHSSGYCKEIFEAMGKPIINIVSARSRDESVESAYSNSDNASGVDFNRVRRYMLSTRKDGSICIQVDSEGKYYLWSEDFPNNLR